jgi:hypothetical protein
MPNCRAKQQSHFYQPVHYVHKIPMIDLEKRAYLGTKQFQCLLKQFTFLTKSRITATAGSAKYRFLLPSFNTSLTKSLTIEELLSRVHCREIRPDLTSDPNPNRRPKRLSLAS